jgi:hypothetical protein
MEKAVKIEEIEIGLDSTLVGFPREVLGDVIETMEVEKEIEGNGERNGENDHLLSVRKLG